jgi:hypothetical protein
MISTAIGVKSLHDQVVNLIAQRWAQTTKCRVTVNTTSDKDRWEGIDRRYPDLVGWQATRSRKTVEWIAEVETEESFSELDAHGRWQDYTALGLPFYLFVPKGYAATAQFFASRAGARISRIYEYHLENKQFELS